MPVAVKRGETPTTFFAQSPDEQNRVPHVFSRDLAGSIS
jgi:hypothetical protein